MYLRVLHMCLVLPEEGARFRATSVKDARELPCGYWQSDLGLLQEQPMLLAADHE